MTGVIRRFKGLLIFIEKLVRYIQVNKITVWLFDENEGSSNSPKCPIVTSKKMYHRSFLTCSKKSIQLHLCIFLIVSFKLIPNCAWVPSVLNVTMVHTHFIWVPTLCDGEERQKNWKRQAGRIKKRELRENVKRVFFWGGGGRERKEKEV